ncbi:MAG: LabA-like NYN domain-containing protein [Acidobacteriota bacterium]
MTPNDFRSSSSGSHIAHTPSNRGRVAIFIDGNNLFHAAKSAGVEIDYAKLLAYLRADDPLLRAFFYTGVDQQAERQQGFLLWMRRNGYRVVQKELKTFPDGSKKANLDVEIAVDMLSLAEKYDTAILVSGDEDFTYALNVIAYKGVRVEVAGFRANTSPRLIDVADRFHELDGVIAEISKSQSKRDSQQTEVLRTSDEWPVSPEHYAPCIETKPTEVTVDLTEQTTQPPVSDTLSEASVPFHDLLIQTPQTPVTAESGVIVETLQSGSYPVVVEESWESHGVPLEMEPETAEPAKESAPVLLPGAPATPNGDVASNERPHMPDVPS